MSIIKIRDSRGWDESDPFTLPIIAILDTLEKEGLIKQDILKRMQTVGEISLALTEHLDYYNFILVPAFNEKYKKLIQGIDDKTITEETPYIFYLKLTFIVESIIRTLDTINELLRKFIIEIFIYSKVLPEINYKSLSEDGKKKFRENHNKFAVDFIKEVQSSLNLRPTDWYSFISKIRNFCTHEGALFPDYIENHDIIFYQKNTNRTEIYKLSEILDQIKQFKDIREITRRGLSNVEIWKKKLKK